MIDSLEYREADDMRDSGWSEAEIAERIEDQEARPWLYDSEDTR